MEVTPSIPRVLWQRYLAVAVYLLVSITIVSILGAVLLHFDPASFAKTSGTQLPFRALAYSVLLQLLGFAIPAFFLIRFTRAPVFSFRFATPRDIALCCGLIFASTITFGVLYKYLNIEPKQLGFLDTDEILDHKYAFLFFTGILAPLYEEWVFRGLLFGILVRTERQLRNVVLGGAFCVILFTLVHIEGKHSLSALPPILVMAVIFQYMTWKSKSLWPAIAGHAMQNLLASVFLIMKLSQEAKNSV